MSGRPCGHGPDVVAYAGELAHISMLGAFAAVTRGQYRLREGVQLPATPPTREAVGNCVLSVAGTDCIACGMAIMALRGLGKEWT